MADVQDLRKNPELANAHTELLEDIVESHAKHKTLTKVKKLAKSAMDFAETTGAGALTGYLLSGGDPESTVRFAEYAAALWIGYKAGIELPLRYFIGRAQGVIRESVEEEAEKAASLEGAGQFHAYEPEHGLEFTNSKGNWRKGLENILMKSYWANHETARRPITRAIKNMTLGAVTMWLLSLAVDGQVNVIDWVGPNMIEVTSDKLHELAQHIEPIRDYVSQVSHQHATDFPQLKMAAIGLAGGAIDTAREYVVGHYQNIRAHLRKRRD